MAISLELLTDDDILDYSRSDGKDHVLYSHGDLNLKFDRLQPITGGVYDTEIFGSPMVDRVHDLFHQTLNNLKCHHLLIALMILP